ncbi:MAG: thermonuclease family protein [Deltaproteobacteria bacterium]|nr:thermonuclease family protein [Deltaproteobacteria bacterium]
MKSRRLLVLSTLVALFATSTCTPPGGKRYGRKQAQKSLQKLEAPGLVLGEFNLTAILDGDTVKVDGLDSSLRLTGIDAEETFKNEADRREVEAGWEAYTKAKRGTSARPVKMASPLGEQGKLFAKQWFSGITRVRVERDHPAEIRDRYNRYLTYVFAQKNGVWLNYNVECVRAGMSPYFPKYGQSRRFHPEFIAAQAEAKQAKRGIWADDGMKYPDYPEREAWWTARGEFVAAFRRDGEDKANYVDITHWDAMQKLEALVGKEVVVLGTVGDIRISEKGPTTVTLSRRLFNDFPLVFFDKDVLGTSGISAWRGEFVAVTGVPTFYENKRTKKKQLQIQIDRASQIRLSKIPGLTAPSAGAVAP